MIVCPVSDLKPGDVVRVNTTPPISVFNVDGEFFALDDTCSHQDASLADGWLEGFLVECPLHSSQFDVRTGVPICLPAKAPVRTHRVDVIDDMIVLEPITVA